MVKFKASEIGARFNNSISQYEKLINEAGHTLVEEWSSLQQELRRFNERGFLTVAFVGEYSAGKSTIISALTDRKDIKISADIATDETAEYEWNAIKLIDTPGLFTERKDHDQITYEAVEKSDLLVFCLTHSLFDAVTIENFKNLAYEKCFRQKMMLVINKMSDESGDTDEKIENYKESIFSAVAPHDAGLLTTCFIDALDYIDGLEENDPELVELSRFESFIKELNQFVDSKAALARLDTPVRIFISNLNHAVNRFSRDDTGDNAFLEMLNRIGKVIIRERERLSAKVTAISLHLTSKIVDEGVLLANMISGEEDFDSKSKASEARIQELSQEASEEMGVIIQQAVEDLHTQVKDIYNSPLAENLFIYLEEQEKLAVNNVELDDSFKNFKEKSKKLSNIAEKLGIKIVEKATQGAAKTAAGTFFKASEVAGGELHKMVLAVGKFFGTKFKPWQAANLAKTIGNIAKVVGPVLSVVSLILEGAEQVKENKVEKKLSEARREINTAYLSIAENFEMQFRKQFNEVCAELYGPVEKEIISARIEEETKTAQSSKQVRELLSIRDNLDTLLNDIELQ